MENFIKKYSGKLITKIILYQDISDTFDDPFKLEEIGPGILIFLSEDYIQGISKLFWGKDRPIYY